MQDRIYDFLTNEHNQEKAYKAAIALNGGREENSCVYFVSEVLRSNDFQIGKEVCNISQIISVLNQKGWKKDSDYKNLQSGDICFTTDSKGDKDKRPTHTYIFMEWVDVGKYDIAYICDNQKKQYNDKIYHIRNIKLRTTLNGRPKEAFSFYMRQI